MIKIELFKTIHCCISGISHGVNKLQIVLFEESLTGKELRESLYWLRLIKRAELIQSEKIDPLVSEAKELINIIAKSVVTAKANK